MSREGTAEPALTAPSTLLGPPPRAVETLAPFLSKGTQLAYGVVGAGVAVMPVVAVFWWVETGALDLLAMMVAIGVGSLISTLGMALVLRQRGLQRLLVDGHVRLTRVVNVSRSRSRGGNSWFVIELEDDEHTHTVRWAGRTAELRLKKGDQVPLFELDGQLAVCTPELGAVLLKTR